MINIFLQRIPITGFDINDHKLTIPITTNFRIFGFSISKYSGLTQTNQETGFVLNTPVI